MAVVTEKETLTLDNIREKLHNDVKYLSDSEILRMMEMIPLRAMLLFTPKEMADFAFAIAKRERDLYLRFSK